MTVLRGSLDRGVRPAMARTAKRDQIVEVIGDDVIGEHAKRDDVVRVRSNVPAMLASVVIAGLGLALLGGPIRPAMVNRSPDVLRVQRADSGFVTASSGAKFTAPVIIHGMAGPSGEIGSATDTDQINRNVFDLPRGSVLTRAGAVFCAAMFSTGWLPKECYRTALATKFHGVYHSCIIQDFS